MHGLALEPCVLARQHGATCACGGLTFRLVLAGANERWVGVSEARRGAVTEALARARCLFVVKRYRMLLLLHLDHPSAGEVCTQPQPMVRTRLGRLPRVPDRLNLLPLADCSSNGCAPTAASSFRPNAPPAGRAQLQPRLQLRQRHAHGLAPRRRTRRGLPPRRRGRCPSAQRRLRKGRGAAPPQGRRLRWSSRVKKCRAPERARQCADRAEAARPRRPSPRGGRHAVLPPPARRPRARRSASSPIGHAVRPHAAAAAALEMASAHPRRRPRRPCSGRAPPHASASPGGRARRGPP
eukprot:scaffold66118_cov20-Tisochrysis_lutea.AAC.2